MPAKQSSYGLLTLLIPLLLGLTLKVSAMDVSQIEQQFILSHRVARLATADAAGRPHVIPFCYAFDGAHFYFVVDEKPKRRTGRPLKRIRNLLENPQVALVIDDYSDNWSELAYMLVSGTAAIVENEDEYARALSLLRERYSQYREMNLAFATNPMVRITPTRIHSWGKVESPGPEE
jgi:PPOX class probable F420-dependent enzyme